MLEGVDLAALAEALTALGADGWLLYDFRKINPIAGRILGDTGMGTRRLFVLLPRSGRPVAVAHRIELQALADFPGEVRPYGAWRELPGCAGHASRSGCCRRSSAPASGPTRGRSWRSVRPRRSPTTSRTRDRIGASRLATSCCSICGEDRGVVPCSPTRHGWDSRAVRPMRTCAVRGKR